MSEIQRYEVVDPVVVLARSSGEFVFYTDHVAAMAERDAAWEARIEKWADKLEQGPIGEVLPRIPAALRDAFGTKEVDDGE